MRGAAHCARRTEREVGSSRVVHAYRLPFAEPYFAVLRRALALAPDGCAELSICICRNPEWYMLLLRSPLSVAGWNEAARIFKFLTPTA